MKEQLGGRTLLNVEIHPLKLSSISSYLNSPKENHQIIPLSYVQVGQKEVYSCNIINNNTRIKLPHSHNDKPTLAQPCKHSPEVGFLYIRPKIA